MVACTGRWRVFAVFSLAKSRRIRVTQSSFLDLRSDFRGCSPNVFVGVNPPSSPAWMDSDTTMPRWTISYAPYCSLPRPLKVRLTCCCSANSLGRQWWFGKKIFIISMFVGSLGCLWPFMWRSKTITVEVELA